MQYNKSKLYKALDYWSRDMLDFNFSEKGLGFLFPPHFVHDSSRKMFPMLHSINWQISIAWLPLLLEILDNMSITIVIWSGCDAIKFENNLILLIKSFKYLENRKSFWGETKKHFSFFLKDFYLSKIVSDLRVRL